MSFHPIHPKEVVSAIYHHLGKVKLTVEGNLHQGVYRVVFEALATVREIFERNLNNPDLASKEFRPIVDPREQERLMMPVHQLFLELNDKFSIEKEFDSIIHSFQQAKIHKETMAKEGISKFLTESWAQDLLRYGLEQEHPWALETLHSMIKEQSQKDLGFQIILELFKKSQGVLAILIQIKSTSDFKVYLEKEVSNPASPSKALEAFFYLYSKGYLGDLEIPLFDYLRERKALEKAGYFISQIPQKELILDLKLLDQMILEFHKGEDWSIQFWFSFFSKSFDASLIEWTCDYFFKSSSFSDPGFRIKFMILIEGSFRWLDKCLRKRLNSYLIQSQKSNQQELSLVLQRMIADINQLEISSACLLSLGDDPLYCFRLKEIFLERSACLRQLLLNPQDFPLPKYSRYLTSFPVVKGVMCGSCYRSKGWCFQKEIAGFLRRNLSSDGIEVFQVADPKDKDRFDDVRYIEQEPVQIGDWVQDYVHFAHSPRGLHFLVPNLALEYKDDWTIEAREKRMKHWGENFMQPFYTVPGESIKIKLNEGFFNLADRVGKLKSNTTAQILNLEGGNVLVGVCPSGPRQGEPFAIVGRDSLGFNEQGLLKEFQRMGFVQTKEGRWIEDFQGKSAQEVPFIPEELFGRIVQQDLGIQNVFFVEQPYNFHLDMAMAIIGDCILLNHAEEAFELGQKIFKETIPLKEQESEDVLKFIAECREEAKKIAAYEELVLKQLTELDLNLRVIRIPGIFKNIFKPEPHLHRVNFFNILSLTTPANKKIIVALGADPIELQVIFEKMIRKYSKEKIDKFIFLDSRHSQKLLAKNGGGVHCFSQALEELLVVHKSN